MRAEGGRPPLVERMEAFTRRIALAVLVAAGGIAVIGIFVGDYGITEMFMFGEEWWTSCVAHAAATRWVNRCSQ